MKIKPINKMTVQELEMEEAIAYGYLSDIQCRLDTIKNICCVCGCVEELENGVCFDCALGIKNV